jgi:N-ethylmaleimide reductase
VHEAGGRIFCQLWHVGAMSHPELQVNGALPLAPSAINPHDKAFTAAGHTPTVTPREMTTDQVMDTVQEFRLAARNARRAGFDGAELHGANGYLFSQFFARSMNRRTDRYGGSIENRSRVLFDVLDAISEEMPLDRVGVRLNPALHQVGGVVLDEETYPLFEHVVAKLNDYGLAYLHLMEPINPVDGLRLPAPTVGAHFRPLYRGTIITATDYTRETGNRVLERGHADLVAFGRAFIGNPDLVERFEIDASLNVPDRATFYRGGAAGYVDYLRLGDGGTLETVGNDQRVDLDYATARSRMRAE